MRLVTFTHGRETHIGAMVSRDGQDYILDLNRAQPSLPSNMIQFLEAGEAALELAQSAVVSATPDAWRLASHVTLLAPILRPGKIMCMGYNYRDHTANAGDALPDYPTLFVKCSSAVIGPHQPIVIPRVSSQVDYEAELAFVIGKRARRVAEEQTLEFVAGYTILNDVSARDHIRRSTQWMMGKSFDTFAPLGPALVTQDEVPDPGNIDLYLTLNGQEMQRSNTRHLIFSIPYLIAYISQVMTLEPGDIVSTGTPWGTGITRKPPVFMKPGDVVRICIERIGELVNPVVAEE